MNLLRYRRHVATHRLFLPDGTSRPVKVITNDERTVQQVEDGNHLHGTARPVAIHVSVNPGREIKVRRGFHRPAVGGLWMPVPIDPQHPEKGATK